MLAKGIFVVMATMMSFACQPEEHLTNTAFINAVEEFLSSKSSTIGWTKESDGTVRLTPQNLAKIRAVTELRLDGYDISDKLTDLSDIKYFTGLTVLECSNNHLMSLDVSKNTALESLDCGDNQLTTLDVSNNTELATLDCGQNALTVLDMSKNTELILLWCDDNKLTTLDVSKNTALTDLRCNNNNLTDLDVTNNTELTYLDCSNQSITSLNVSKNTKLQVFICNGNDLAELDITNNTALKELFCGKQTSDGSATQELALTLTAAQKTTWNDEWKTLPRNAAVTVPAETAE